MSLSRSCRRHLPPTERLARFQREAEVLASLSHPHVAGIYGLEESDGMRALVLELVEGETLQQRIARGAIPVQEGALLSGDWKRVRREIAYAAPGLLLPEPAVDLDRLTEALSAAALFEAEGDRAQRNRVLRAVLVTAAPRPDLDDSNEARTARVKAHAALGDRESALKELQAAVDAGYRTLWDDDLIRFEREPNLAAIRNDREFMAIIARGREDLRRQRDQVLKSRR